MAKLSSCSSGIFGLPTSETQRQLVTSESTSAAVEQLLQTVSVALQRDGAPGPAVLLVLWFSLLACLRRAKK